MAAAGAGAGEAGADDGMIGPGDCGLCYAPIPESDVYVLHNINGVPHKFHRACITQWLLTTIQTGAPFVCPVCSLTDDEVRVSARGIAWAERLALILMIRQVDLTRIPGLDPVDLNRIPDELWPTIAFRIEVGIQSISVVFIAYFARLIYTGCQRFEMLYNRYSLGEVYIAHIREYGAPGGPLLISTEHQTMIDGVLVDLLTELPELTREAWTYTFIVIAFMVVMLVTFCIGIHIQNRAGRGRRGGGGEEKKICINDVCYPIPEKMEYLLIFLLTTLKPLLAKMDKIYAAHTTRKTKEGGRRTRKRAKASHKAAHPSKK
jgi:hypothetical protein